MWMVMLGCKSCLQVQMAGIAAESVLGHSLRWLGHSTGWGWAAGTTLGRGRLAGRRGKNCLA
jgi:hypothetical protein